MSPLIKIDSPNYTQVPNCILDNLAGLNDTELRVLLVIVRQTIGWQRKRHPMSISFLEKASGLSRQGVVKGTVDLMLAGIVKKIESKEVGGSNSFELVVNDVDHPVNKVDHPPVNAVDPKKERAEEKNKRGAPLPPVPGEETIPPYSRENKEPDLPEAEIPTEAQFIAYCKEIGLTAEWFALDKFLAAKQVNWDRMRDWRVYATRCLNWWREKGSPMQAGSSPGAGGGNGAPKKPTLGQLQQQLRELQEFMLRNPAHPDSNISSLEIKPEHRVKLRELRKRESELKEQIALYRSE